MLALCPPLTVISIVLTITTGRVVYYMATQYIRHIELRLLPRSERSLRTGPVYAASLKTPLCMISGTDQCCLVVKLRNIIIYIRVISTFVILPVLRSVSESAVCLCMSVCHSSVLHQKG